MIIIKNEHLILILQLIHRKGSIEYLKNDGLEYAEILELITYLVDNEYVEYDDSLDLTESGKEFLNDLNLKMHRKSSERLISPQNEYIIDKKGIYDIYLPKSIDFL